MLLTALTLSPSPSLYLSPSRHLGKCGKRKEKRSEKRPRIMKFPLSRCPKLTCLDQSYRNNAAIAVEQLWYMLVFFCSMFEYFCSISFFGISFAASFALHYAK